MKFLSAFLLFIGLANLAATAQSYEDSLFAVPQGRTLHGDYRAVMQDPSLYRQADTSLDKVHLYDPAVYRNLGSIGTPAFELFFPKSFRTGFNLGFRQWDAYRNTREGMPFYNTQNPFTDFHYVQGQQQFQGLHAIHTQNLLPNWNAAISHDMLSVRQGEYDLQLTSLHNTVINTWYRSPSARYVLTAGALFNRYQAQENGGLEDVRSFDTLSSNNRSALPVSLDAAKQRYREHDYTVRQAFYLGRRVSRTLSDSDSVAVKLLLPRYYVSHSISHYKEEYLYLDSLQRDTFYPNTFLGNKSRDLFWQRQISNRAGIGRTAFTLPDTAAPSAGMANAGKGLAGQLFAQYDLIKLSEGNTSGFFEELYTNTSVGAEIRRSGTWALEASAQYYIHGYNAGDHNVAASLTLPFIPNKMFPFIGLEASSQTFEPGYTDELLLSNHFYWNNPLGKISVQQGSAYLADKGIGKLGARYAQAQNWVYYSPQGQPLQATGNDFRYVQAFASKKLDWKNFNFLNELVYQKVLQGHYVRMPEFYVHSSWYWQGMIPKFSRTLVLKVGAELTYYSKYNSYSYMPGISRFVIGNGTAGNYPFVDVFLAARVKRFQVFAKLEHMNHGLSGRQYYVLPSYPLYPRSFRLGIRWTFYN